MALGTIAWFSRIKQAVRLTTFNGGAACLLALQMMRPSLPAVPQGKNGLRQVTRKLRNYQK